jgi:hypothetical protein
MFDELLGEGEALDGAGIRYVLTRRVQRHHVIQWQRVANHPWLVVPALYLDPRGPADDAPALIHVDELTRYFIQRPGMARKRMLYTSRACGLLHDYSMEVGAARLLHAQPNTALECSNFITGFVTHLRFGTIGDDGEDPTGLYWPPAASRRNAEDLIRALEAFLEHAHEQSGNQDVTTCLDHHHPSTVTPFFRNLHIARFNHNISFLKHIKTAEEPKSHLSRPALGPTDRPLSAGVPVCHAFPTDLVAPMLVEAFVLDRKQDRPAGDLDITGLLHTICLYGLGLRPLEPLHIWDTDVQLIGNEPMVLLHHPADARTLDWQVGPAGTLPSNTIGMNRERYLKLYCNMAPRTRAAGALYAGFKGMALNSEHWAPSYWIPVEGISALFWEVFRVYVSQVRPHLMEKRTSRGLPSHPFLLVCDGSGYHDPDPSSIGGPYTEAAFRGSWKRALRRLHQRRGDSRLIMAKDKGTTPHGLRHEYGSHLAASACTPDVIQQCMHHISPFSQLTYTKPKDEKVAAQLEAARYRIDSETLIDRAAAPLKSLAEQLHTLKYRLAAY